MVEGGSDILCIQELGYLLGLFPVAGIDDSRAFHAVQDVEKLFGLVFRTADDVGKILAFEAHPEHVLFLECQPLLNIFHHFGRSRGGKGEYRYTGEQLTYI